MIRAIFFDLDGTLVQSEKLKALAYAMAVAELRGLEEPPSEAIEAYREIVGASRDEASRHVMDRLGLEPLLRPLVAEHRVAEPWDVLSGMRRAIYEDMVADPQVLRDNQWPHTVGLLRVAREHFCKTGLATMSQRDEAHRVLRALDLEDTLDLVLGREDVTNAKPDPEIYLTASERVGVPPSECLVLEDSPNGVRSGLAAGMSVIAVATPFTREQLHATRVIDEAWIVDDPDTLLDVVRRQLDEHNRTEH